MTMVCIHMTQYSVRKKSTKRYMSHDLNVIIHKYLCRNPGTKLLAVVILSHFNVFFIVACIFQIFYNKHPFPLQL